MFFWLWFGCIDGFVSGVGCCGVLFFGFVVELVVILVGWVGFGLFVVVGVGLIVLGVGLVGGDGGVKLGVIGVVVGLMGGLFWGLVIVVVEEEEEEEVLFVLSGGGEFVFFWVLGELFKIFIDDFDSFFWDCWIGWLSLVGVFVCLVLEFVVRNVFILVILLLLRFVSVDFFFLIFVFM